MSSVPSPSRRFATVLLALFLVAAPAALAACSSPEPGDTSGSPTPGGTTSAGSTPSDGTGPTDSPTTGPSTDPTTGSGGTPGPSGRTTVILTRSGGFAGVRQSIQIRPDGSWSFYDKRVTTPKSGKLTPAQLQAILKMATDPGMIAEIRRQSKPGTCNDAFDYSIQVGESQASFTDCGQNRPLTDKFIKAITDATPL